MNGRRRTLLLLPPLFLLLFGAFVEVADGGSGVEKGADAVGDCPGECVCKWKGGKETLSCRGTGYRQIPEVKGTGTQVLDFPGNNLTWLSDDVFPDRNMENLQQINLGHCGILGIRKFAFRGLRNLDRIDLSGNELGTVPTDPLSAVPLLRELVLSRNPIRELSDFSFRGLGELVRLELSECKIDAIEAHAFSGLESLEWLKLDGNFLSHLAPTQLRPLGAKLHGIDLHQETEA